MSSHHIVRDEQEPALLIHRLSDFDTVHLHGLLEWSPTVVCCEPALERYLELGHKVDIALVNLANHDFWVQKLSAQQPLKIVATHDVQFMVTGIHILQKENHGAVNLVTNTDAVYDVIDEMTEWMNMLDIVVFAGAYRYLFVREQFIKWLPAGSQLRAIALEERPKWETHEPIENSTDEITIINNRDKEVSIKCTVPFLIEEAL